MTQQSSPFFEHPILNSPYAEPSRHHPLDAEGQPLNEPPRDGRRKSELITPVPKPRKKKRQNADQANLDLHSDDGISTEEQQSWTRRNLLVESPATRLATHQLLTQLQR